MHDLVPPYHRRSADHELPHGLVVAVLAVLCVPKRDLHRAQRRAEIGARVLVVQHVGLADRTGDLRVREGVDGPRAAVDLQFEQLARVQFDRRSPRFIVGVNQTWCMCQTGSFRHSASIERLRFPPLVELP